MPSQCTNMDQNLHEKDNNNASAPTPISSSENATMGNSKEFKDLNTDVLYIILKYLGVKDLRAFRLTAKRYADHGRPFLCVNVNFTETKASLDRLLLISSQDEEITSSVKNLQYMPFDLDCWFEYGECVGKVCNLGCKPLEKHFEVPGKCGPLWKDHQDLVHERRDLAEEETHKKVLINAFKHIRPTSIQISVQNFTGVAAVRRARRGPFSAAQWRSEQPKYMSFEEAKSKGYRYPMIKHDGPHELYNDLRNGSLVDRVTKVFLGFSGHRLHAPMMTRSFLDMLWAVDRAAIKLKSLKASTGLSFLAEVPANVDLSYCQTALSNLEELELIVTLDRQEVKWYLKKWDLDGARPNAAWISIASSMSDEELRNWETSITEKGILGKVLRETSKLLRLDLCIHGRYDIELLPRLPDELELLGNRKWDHLKEIKLAYFNCTEKGLLDFIRRHQKTLVHVELRSIEFHNCMNGADEFLGGLFEKVRNEVVSGNLKLETFRVNGTLIGGDILPPSPWIEQFRISITEEQSKRVNDYALGLADSWKIPESEQAE